MFEKAIKLRCMKRKIEQMIDKFSATRDRTAAEVRAVELDTGYSASCLTPVYGYGNSLLTLADFKA